ncbi:hypothetical protein [Psychrobacter sp. P2G3]|uniref:hypothetical protein n=1 Tax=Psychrobacter sp. P2G3 TaxID=1699622 RepID=UPI00078E51C7|nr:hypothetical protein [Psychrobacter sp. P2G3]AMN50690.1 hypothetical protein AK823_13145 [Psychrobacter sp. P2G3]
MSLIHFSKVSALTILAVTIVACSSGGNHTKTSPITPPLSEQDAADKAAADKAAADKAAADKAADDKAAADKVEKERLQKIEANRLVLLDKAKKAGLSDKQATA